MKILKYNKPDNTEKLNAYSKIMKSVAAANIVFDVSYKEAIQILKEELVLTASERNPGWKKTKIGTITGIDRKLINNILDKTRSNIDATPLQKVLFHVVQLCEQEKINKIKIKGEIISFKTLVDQEYKGQHSYISILEEGVDKKCFKVDEDYVYLIDNHTHFDNDPKEYLNYIGTHYQLIMKTAEFNFNKKERKHKKIQNSNWSSNINEKYHPEVEKEMTDIINKCKAEIKDVLDKWEVKSNKSAGKGKNQIGAFQRIGCFFNVFSGR